MSKQGKQGRGGGHQPGEQSRTAEARKPTAHAKKPRSRANREGWFKTKRPVLRFVVMLAGFMILFNTLFYLWLAKTPFFESYVVLNGKAAAIILRLFGEGAETIETTVRSSRFSLNIRHGCDAVQASAFFVFAMLASPSPRSLWVRLVPIVIGTLVLLVMNLVRIVTLFYTGIYYPNAFEIMHIDVWQALFIFFPIFFWVMWTRWETRRRTA